MKKRKGEKMGNKKEKTRKGPTQKNLNHYKTILSGMSTSQCQKILKHLIRYGRITTFQAYEKYGCTRLPARISDLKDMGINITTEMCYKKSPGGGTIHYGIYRLA